MITQRLKRPFLLLILFSYLFITVSYAVINPLFEAPDEHWHYFTTQYVADTGQLPFVAPGDNYDKWLSQEAAQPPLYYLIGAMLIRPIDTTGAREQVWENPFAWAGDASLVSNYNRFIHTDAEAWPWSGYALAAQLLRLLSTLFGLGTLICVYGNGRLLWPGHTHRALLATALVAFLPQFNFLHASVSNDSLVIFLASAALWQLVWLWKADREQLSVNSKQLSVRSGILSVRRYRRRLVWLGVTIGLAALAKNAGIVLFVYAVGFLLLHEMSGWGLGSSKSKKRRGKASRSISKDVGTSLLNLLFLIVPVLFIASTLWWRNWVLYSDPTAASVFVRIAGGDRHYTLWQVFGESGGLWRSLFAVFGWFNRRAPEWLYAMWDGIVMIGVLGWLIGRDWRLKIGDWSGKSQSLFSNLRVLINRSLPLLLFGWVLAVYAGLVSFMLQTEAAQGRLLFPAIVPLALGLAYGLTVWENKPLTNHLGRGMIILAPLLALTTTIYSLLFVIRPAYALPQLLDSLPPEAVPINQPVSDDLLLLGAEVPETAVLPDTLLPLTIYWQATATPATPPEFVLQLFGRDLTLIGQLHSYHGRGMYPATLWPVGKVVADEIVVRVNETAVSPTLGRLLVGIDEDDTRHELPAIKIVPPTWPEPNNEPLAQLGDDILLTDAALSTTTVKAGDTATISTQWQATAAPRNHFTTLLHLAEAGQPPLAQGDRPPLNGDYPTTVWTVDEVINDSYQLTIPPDLPAGRYPLWLGMYDSATVVRLPLTVDGDRQQHDLFLLGHVEVTD
ncbi:MAG: hypothetical protein AAF614_29335 [Chloroflexota bacterium]